jgi:hypothetical protein
MADGLSASNVNATLAEIVASASFVQLHTADPGAAGTTAVSSVTTRQSVTWGSASGGTITASNTPEWTNWAGSNDTITDISFWSLGPAGTGVFEFSVQLSSPVTMAATDSLSLTPLSVTLPVAS